MPPSCGSARQVLASFPEQRFAQFEANADARFAKFEVQIERGFNAQSRFILLCWATLLAAIIALK